MPQISGSGKASQWIGGTWEQKRQDFADDCMWQGMGRREMKKRVNLAM